jgi:hypothetical protein
MGCWGGRLSSLGSVDTPLTQQETLLSGLGALGAAPCTPSTSGFLSTLLWAVSKAQTPISSPPHTTDHLPTT